MPTFALDSAMSLSGLNVNFRHFTTKISQSLELTKHSVLENEKSVMERNSMINSESVKAYLESHEGAIGLLDVQECVIRELRALLAPAPEGFSLAAYANLRPSDEQMRRALLTLLEEVGEDGRRVFRFQNQWLAVTEVLVFLRLIEGGFGKYAATEHYVNQLFPEGLRIACKQRDLSMKSGEYPFNKGLAVWEKHKQEQRVKPFWAIAECLLRSLA